MEDEQDDRRTHKLQRPLPTEAERAAIIAEIQAGWDARTELSRRVDPPRPVIVRRGGGRISHDNDGGYGDE